jgi:hypothetical protein
MTIPPITLACDGKNCGVFTRVELEGIDPFERAGERLRVAGWRFEWLEPPNAPTLRPLLLVWCPRHPPMTTIGGGEGESIVRAVILPLRSPPTDDVGAELDAKLAELRGHAPPVPEAHPGMLDFAFEPSTDTLADELIESALAQGRRAVALVAETNALGRVPEVALVGELLASCLAVRIHVLTLRTRGGALPSAAVVRISTLAHTLRSAVASLRAADVGDASASVVGNAGDAVATMLEGLVRLPE